MFDIFVLENILRKYPFLNLMFNLIKVIHGFKSQKEPRGLF